MAEYMATEAEQLRAQATRLFARASQARDQGNVHFAEVLTASAERSLQNAVALEAALPAVMVPPAGQQPVAQQQQQVQPDKDELGTRARTPASAKALNSQKILHLLVASSKKDLPSLTAMTLTETLVLLRCELCVCLQARVAQRGKAAQQTELLIFLATTFLVMR